MSYIHLQHNNHVAELCIDNPNKLNALTMSMLMQLEKHCDYIENNSDVRVLLVKATGERFFCVGADVKEWSTLTPAQFARNWVRKGHRIFDRLANLSIPTIALLEASAFGGGLELAAACDIRLAKPQINLGLPEPSVGVVPGWSGTQRLQRLLPESVIKAMLFFNHHITSDQAYTLGFITVVSDDVQETAQSFIKKCLKQSPRALETTKYMLHAGAGEQPDALLEALGSGMIAATDDKAEGVAAFLEKRSPQFLG